MVTKKNLKLILCSSTISFTLALWITLVFPNYKNFFIDSQQNKWLKTLVIINNPILMDFNDFHYTINNYPCLNNDVFLITIIHSAPHNLKKRNIIRTSWGMGKDICSKQIHLVFLLAKVLNSSVQADISQENSLYGDIIQGNFMDSYKNLTYKNIMGKKWLSEYCPNAKYVLKTDDDIYVDIFKLFNLLQTDFRNKTTEFIACYQWKAMGVSRDPNNKWYLSIEEYPEGGFSPYCAGFAYILTPDVASKIYAVSGEFKYLFIDDFLVTGPMVDKAGLNRTELNYLYTFDNKELMDWVENNDTKPCKYMTGWYDENFELAMKLWSKTVLSWTPLFKELCKSI